MTSRTVYSDRAEFYKPRDAASIAREVMRLHADGLMPRDIAELFHMQVSEIETIIRKEKSA